MNLQVVAGADSCFFGLRALVIGFSGFEDLRALVMGLGLSGFSLTIIVTISTLNLGCN